jgi:hypothetical protein
MARATLTVPELQRSTRRVPVEAIIQTLGANPAAQGIDKASAVLAQALQERAAKRQAAAQVAAISQTVGHPMTGIQDPAIAASLGGHFIAADKQPVKTPEVPPIYVTRNASGGVMDAFTNQPIAAPDPTKKYQFVGNDANADIRSINTDLRRESLRNTVISAFNSNPEVKKAEENISLAGTVREFIDQPNALQNPIADKAVQTIITRAFEKGALSEADKKPYGGSQAFTSKLQQAYQTWKGGTLTPENRAFLIDVGNKIQKRAIENKTRIAVRHSDQFGRNSALFASPKELQSILIGDRDSVLMSEGLNNPSPKPTHRWNPATGKVEVIQ